LFHIGGFIYLIEPSWIRFIWLLLVFQMMIIAFNISLLMGITCGKIFSSNEVLEN